MRVLHTPYNEANNAFGLSMAERLIGIESQLIIFRHDGYFRRSDCVLFGRLPILNEIVRWAFVVYVMLRFDGIHYNFGSYLAPTTASISGRWPFLRKLYNKFYAEPLTGLDVKIAAKLGKRVFVTFQGSDCRILEYCRSNYEYHFAKEEGFHWSHLDDAYRQQRVDIFAKYATRIFAVNPDLLNTLPERAEFIPYTSVYPQSTLETKSSKHQSVFRVVHAPSNRVIKGTKYLEGAIARLKEDGYNIELTLVENLSNVEAMDIYKSADIVVDQLLAGWYGGFAVEAMSIGKPVVCYIRDSDLRHIPEEMRDAIPIINANPDSVYEVLKSLLTAEREDLAAIGQKSIEYVQRWHNPIRIAKEMKTIYTGESDTLRL